MGKLGKKKLAELADSGENANFNDKDSPDTDDVKSRSSSQKRAGSSTTSDRKRKASAASSKLSSVDDDISDSEDSDNLPLNGSKSGGATAGGAAPSKSRKGAATKSKAAIAKQSKPEISSNNKKKNAKNLNSNSNDEESASIAEESPDDTEFEVEAIVGHKWIRNVSYFCVRWKGYSAADDTWEPESDLNCNALIEEYRKKNPQNDDNNKKSTTTTTKNKKGNNKSGGRGRPPGSGGGGGATSAKSNSNSSDPNKEWSVVRIVDFVEDDEQGPLYRIRWKGFGAKDDTWEPESNLSCVNLIEKFKKGLEQQRNVDTKDLRESPKKTKRLVNETAPRSNLHNRIGRTSKRSVAKNRVYYGEE